MTPILADLSPAAVLPGMDANLGGYYLHFGRLPGGEVHDDASLTWVASGVPEAHFNGVVRADLDPVTVDLAVAGVLAEFRRRGLPLRWHVGPSTRPATLGATLLVHGFTLDDEEPGMAADLHATSAGGADGHPPLLHLPPELTIEPVLDDAGLNEWIEVWMFGAPPAVRHWWHEVYRVLGVAPERPWQCFLGRWEGRPVATVKLYYEAGIVAVHHVVTRPELRRRGIGAALTAYAMREARDRGYRIAVLTASEEGFNIYQRLGFRTYCTVQRYRWEPDRAAPVAEVD